MTDTAGRNEPVMPPGRELDALVGEIVFGFWFEQGRWWGKHPTMPGNRAYASCAFSQPLFGPSYDQSNSLPKFSTSWDAMRLVVERLVALDLVPWIIVHHEGATCSVSRPSGEVLSVFDTGTAPHGLALAALKAVEADRE